MGGHGDPHSRYTLLGGHRLGGGGGGSIGGGSIGGGGIGDGSTSGVGLGRVTDISGEKETDLITHGILYTCTL